ncbi:MAG: aminoacyl--tRNA ligase-related protein [Candidatus Veblenbacteria bacterium]|nr:aminoacyl--tRNA ligase-related protein [Candidatus Veblenbacteria bacterium]
MLQSQLFTKTSRAVSADEVSVNARLLAQAGFIDKQLAGVYSFLPLGLRVLRRIEQIVREEMLALNAQELLMPVLHPKANWEQTGRWDTYDTLFRFVSYHSKNDYALGPTHEEIVAPLAKKFILSYQDLPRYVFQIQTKFRDEKRAKSGLLRGREFLMKDLYSFHCDEADLDSYYERAQAAYVRVFERMGLGEDTVLTFASGGTFAKYSHEFQTLIPAGEDTIYLCADCRVAVNKEIISEQPTCPNCGAAELTETVGAEVGNIFKLKTKYSAPFALQYKDQAGKEHDVVMGCYGIGISRLMGVLAEKFHDDKGLRWPEPVAPYQVHLIRLGEEEKVTEQAAAAYHTLHQAGVEVLYDDRTESAGVKFKDADLIGIPWRLVVSEKTAGRFELKSRSEESVTLLDLKEVLNKFSVRP